MYSQKTFLTTTLRFSSIGMPSRSDTKRARFETFLAEHRPPQIDEDFLLALEQHLAPVSSSYLRQLVRASGLPLSPMVEGVRQDSLEEAERTLLGLAGVYVDSDAAGRRQARSLVIESKDRLQWAIKRTNDGPARRAIQHEILLWMMTWLENPAVFASWLTLRKRDRQVTGSESRPL
jgi:hypothetical protein